MHLITVRESIWLVSLILKYLHAIDDHICKIKFLNYFLHKRLDVVATRCCEKRHSLNFVYTFFSTPNSKLQSKRLLLLFQYTCKAGDHITLFKTLNICAALVSQSAFFYEKRKESYNSANNHRLRRNHMRVKFDQSTPWPCCIKQTMLFIFGSHCRS